MTPLTDDQLKEMSIHDLDELVITQEQRDKLKKQRRKAFNRQYAKESKQRQLQAKREAEESQQLKTRHLEERLHQATFLLNNIQQSIRFIREREQELASCRHRKLLQAPPPSP